MSASGRMRRSGYAFCVPKEEYVLLITRERIEFPMKKNYIRYQIINYDRHRELLKRIPHIPYLDLAIVFYSRIPEEEKHPYGFLTWKGMKKLGVSLEELEELAAQETPKEMPPKLLGIEQLLEEVSEEEKMGLTPKLPMYVLTNEQHIFGAACILYPGLLEGIAAAFSSDFYILPSSVHECILIPETADTSREELAKIVKEINEKQVPPEEILSDRVYVYRRIGDRITM